MAQKFFKFTSESLSASYIPFPRFLMEDSLAGLSNDAKVLYALMLDRASISKVNGFPNLLHRGTGAEEAAPQPTMCDAGLPGTGVQRLDYPKKAGLGQARPHHAELPSGRKANSAKRGWRNIARIKVENKVFSAPQALRKHWC